jgi:hypothetical protein
MDEEEMKLKARRVERDGSTCKVEQNGTLEPRTRARKDLFQLI